MFIYSLYYKEIVAIYRGLKTSGIWYYPRAILESPCIKKQRGEPYDCILGKILCSYNRMEKSYVRMTERKNPYDVIRKET